MQDITSLDGNATVQLLAGYAVPALKALLILAGAWLLSAWTRKAARGALDRARVEPTVAAFAANMARWAVLAVGGVAVLGIFGVDTASFAVVIGALGLAVGLALQGTLGNAASGFMLLIFRPFKVGDVVSVGGVTGRVVEIELFSTALDTPDNRRLIVPNGSIFGSTIENVTHHALRRVDVPVGVAYDAEVARTRAVLLEAAGRVEGALAEPAPEAVLDGLGDSAVGWTVRVWAPSADYFAVRDRVTERVKNALDAAGIGIPFPQMDVHVRAPAPLTLATAPALAATEALGLPADVAAAAPPAQS